MIGLFGAHRTGKTTLAHALSRAANIPVVSFNNGQLQKEIGAYSSNQSQSFEERMVIQNHLLKRYAQILREATEDHGLFITDRTPLDLIGYTIVIVKDKTCTPQQAAWLSEYISNCVALTNHYYKHCVLVQPGIPLVMDNTTSANIDPAFIEHLNLIYKGMFMDMGITTRLHYIPQEITDINARIHLLSTLPL